MATRERGVCPRCGSGEVTHILYGYPGAWPTEEWVTLGGCVLFGDEHNRSCAACGHEWSA